MTKRIIDSRIMARNYCYQGSLSTCIHWRSNGDPAGGWLYVDVWSDPDW